MQNNVEARRALPKRADWTTNPLLQDSDIDLDLDADEWRDLVESIDTSQISQERRNTIMINGLKAGLTLEEVGTYFGLSRERVRQIAATRGIVTRQLREMKKAQAARRANRLARNIYGVSLAYPELDIDEIAEWVDADETTVRKALGPRIAIHDVRSNSKSIDRTTNSELLAALRQWGAQTSRATGDDYSKWASERGIPGKQTVAIRFGSWNDALAAAGLEEFILDRGGLRPFISDETLWASVLEFFRADLDNYSFQAYDQYARKQGLGSGASVRNRLGTWTQIKVEVKRLLRYAAQRDGSDTWAESVLAIIPGEEPRNEVTKEEVIAVLRRVADRTSGPLTVQAYEDARNDDDPNAAIAQNRCGSWVDALLEAGLAHRMSRKAKNKLAQRNIGNDDSQ